MEGIEKQEVFPCVQSSERLQTLGLLDVHGRPRLKLARNHFLFEADLDLDLALDYFNRWRLLDESVVLEHIESGKLLKIDACKRGNEIYFRRNATRLEPLFRALDHAHGRFFDPHANVKRSPLIELDLTHNRENSLKSSWNTLGADFNRWITAFREKYGQCAVLRTWESQEDGYSHIHALIYCFEFQFDVFSYNAKWRVKQKGGIQCGWIGFYDVKAVESWKSAGRYVVKHVVKELTHETNSEHDVKMQNLSLMLCWLFRKRSFSLSGSWDDLIRSLRNSKVPIPQILDRYDPQAKLDVVCGAECPDPPKVWRFVGVVRSEILPKEAEFGFFDWTSELRSFFAVFEGERFAGMDFDKLFELREPNRCGRFED
jgi:hypothetical protein